MRVTMAMKLGAGFGAVLAILVGNGLLAIHQNRAGVERVETMTQLGARSGEVASLIKSVSKVRIAMRDFTISPSEKTSLALEQACETTDHLIEEERPRFTGKEQAPILNELDESFGAYRAGTKKLVEQVTKARSLYSASLNPNGELLASELNQKLKLENDPVRRLLIAGTSIEVLNARLSVKGYLLEESAQMHANATSQLQLATTHIQELGDLKLSELIRSYIGTFEQIQVLNAQRVAIRAGQLDPAAARLGGAIDQLQASIDTSVAESTALAKQEATTATTMGLVFLLVSVGLGVSAAVGLSKGISNAVRRVSQRAEAIAANDLTGEDLPVTSTDELGQLSRCVNSMTASLRGIVAELSTAASEVSAASTQIAASSEQISAGLQEQESQVMQISSAAQEMSGAASDIATKAAEANSEARAAGGAAQTGAQTVGSTVTGMRKIAESVRAAGTSATELGKRGEEIGRIIQVITDIADQTNLLALNAAIEAARAGEHGRGFAVVADEVRKLAERTVKATDEVSESINAIQSETATTVQQMKSGTAEVEQGVVLAGGAGESLGAIVTRTSAVESSILAILAAAEEQSAATTQVSKSIAEITSTARQAAAGAGQAAAATTQLSAKAESLQQIVQRFRVQDRQEARASSPRSSRAHGR
ncbi:MAG: methyl-accepting chemotaxis protein [Planctomycetota bacterium]|nr:methyl-accepting chemotaxis protein [Planctomycetota bacterium]